MKKAVEIVEVTPRDGFQVVKPFIPTEQKIAVIEALAAAGFKRIEIGAFVSAKALPQMADIREVLAGARLPNGLRVQVLVANARGYEAAIAAGVREICWVQSVSESHNRSNVKRTPAESFAEFASVWSALRHETAALRFNLATCFDCPFEGRIGERCVLAAVERVLELAPDVELGIADTTGRAATDHVGALFADLVARYQSGRVRLCFHGHDTYNLGIANAIAAYHAGVGVFDGGAAGLGGCPFAPGATGNTASEDLVFAFEHMGIATGIDLERLLLAADLAADVAPAQAAGRVRNVPRARTLAGFGANTRGSGIFAG